jgi:carboxylate-amine ligase
VEANFSAPAFTLGIEEELMILDPEAGYSLANAIQDLIEDAEGGDLKPELLECVLEIATRPANNTAEAGIQLRALRRQASAAAARHGLQIASAGTHPFSLWEDQRISAGERYRHLVSELKFVARQELIFGLHVHVGIDDREKAIHVANGMRVHVPILTALGANSPYWRGDDSGLASARVPIFRAFPRVGIPPVYDGWQDYEDRIAFMVESGAIRDYTYLWFDVRPHPTFGTVEVRATDGQTRVEHTLALAALIQAMCREIALHYESGQKLADYPYEMLDENKWAAARHGMHGELVDLPTTDRVSSRELARRLYDRLRDHAVDLGSVNEFDGLLELLEGGTGADRQRVVYEANMDFHELVREIVEATAA